VSLCFPLGKAKVGMTIKQAFGEALRHIRICKKLTQENFADVSGRTYLSSIERGLKSPTIEKLDELSQALGVHPVTLLASCYLTANPDIDAEALLKRVRSELRAIPKVVAPEPPAPDNA
jgi:transcriptional regulator with XRE-family HTH domain